MAKPTDPTAVNWQGDLTALPLDLLNRRTNALARWIANGVVRGSDPNDDPTLVVDPLQEYRDAAAEQDRRVMSGDWNHDGRGEWAEASDPGGRMAE